MLGEVFHKCQLPCLPGQRNSMHGVCGSRDTRELTGASASGRHERLAGAASSLATRHQRKSRGMPRYPAVRPQVASLPFRHRPRDSPDAFPSRRRCEFDLPARRRGSAGPAAGPACGRRSPAPAPEQPAAAGILIGIEHATLIISLCFIYSSHFLSQTNSLACFFSGSACKLPRPTSYRARAPARGALRRAAARGVTPRHRRRAESSA